MDIKVKSKDRKGGITAGVINNYSDRELKENKSIWANPWFKYVFIVIITGVIVGLILMGLNQMFGKKENKTQEVYNVESHNQQGGVTAGKIDNLNILTDKESLGIRETDGLYQNGKKVGTVHNFNADESSNTFTIAEIEFDKPLRNMSSIFQPCEYQNYIIKINHIDLLIGIPPGAKIIRGNILAKTS